MEVDDDAIRAEYNQAVLEVVLPISEDAVAQGKTIPVEG
jgi:HSP20 family molecular chaperone IbpA